MITNTPVMIAANAASFALTSTRSSRTGHPQGQRAGKVAAQFGLVLERHGLGPEANGERHGLCGFHASIGEDAGSAQHVGCGAGRCRSLLALLVLPADRPVGSAVAEPTV